MWIQCVKLTLRRSPQDCSLVRIFKNSSTACCRNEDVNTTGWTLNHSPKCFSLSRSLSWEAWAWKSTENLEEIFCLSAAVCWRIRRNDDPWTLMNFLRGFIKVISQEADNCGRLVITISVYDREFSQDRSQNIQRIVSLFSNYTERKLTFSGLLSNGHCCLNCPLHYRYH